MDRGDFVAQLRHLLTAKESAEVADEGEHYRPSRPGILKLVFPPVQVKDLGVRGVFGNAIHEAHGTGKRLVFPAHRPTRAQRNAESLCYTAAVIERVLPGREWIEQGMGDLARGLETIPALLVSIGAPRLRRIGFPVPDPAIACPEIRLYLKLQESADDAAHSRYNALIRLLVSFERAAECAG
jgi:hypothetical protein